MNYAVDQIVEDIVIVEDTITGEKKVIDKTVLPEEIKEGTILTLVDDNYIINNKEEQIRKERIKDKLERLKKLKKD